MLTKEQFDILYLIYDNKTKTLSSLDISNMTGYSIENINKILTYFKDSGFYDGSTILQKGIDALSPYKVKRAIFLAAGFGSRLVPITLNTPKPLIRVNGKRLIDTLLDAVYSANIEEVYVVRGYLKEQFDQLLYKYPNIKFIDNDLFNESNNISSAMKIKDILANSYVLESDLLLSNKKLIRSHEYNSNFLGIPVKFSNDWCLYTDENGIIKKQCIGGENCYQMIGISYWNETDGKKLKEDIDEIWNSPGGKERYWDQVSLEYKKENYKISVRECKLEDIVEIDTFNELKVIDKSYDK